MGEACDFSDPCWREKHSDGDWDEPNRQEQKKGKDIGHIFQPKPFAQAVGSVRDAGREREKLGRREP